MADMHEKILLAVDCYDQSMVREFFLSRVGRKVLDMGNRLAVWIIN